MKIFKDIKIPFRQLATVVLVMCAIPVASGFGKTTEWTGKENAPDSVQVIKLIKQAKKEGVQFGRGDPYNRLRYYTKIGWLPHMTRKKTKSKKDAASTEKPDSQSLRKKVFDFFQKHPKASNQKLYAEFAEYSKNKLRHYKSSYFKTAQSTEAKSPHKPAKKGLKSKTHHPLQQARPKSLEARVARLEEQVDYLSEIIIRQSGKSEFKAALSGTAIGIEKKIKELEETIAGFISARRKKIKTEMSNLEEIQQLVSDKISSFIKGFK